MSKQINRSIVIDAKVKTTLEGMGEVVSKLNQGLRDGTTKVDLTKGVGSSLSKQIGKFKDEYSKFSKYIEGGKIEFADSKDAIKSGETLIKTFKEMRRIVGDFDDLTVIDAKKLFPDAFDSKVSDLLKGLNGLSSAMTKLESKQLDLTTAQTEMGELTKEAQRLQSLVDQKISLKLELDQAESDLEHFDSEIEAIRAKAAKGITLKINTATTAHDEAKKKIEEIETTRNARGFNQEDFSGTTTRAVKFKGKTEKQWTDESTKKDASEASKAEAAAALEAIRIYRQEESALKDLNSVLQTRKKEVDSLRESLSNINNMKVSQAVEIAGGTADEINEANTAMQVHAEATKEAAAARVKYNTAAQQAKGASDKIERTNAALEAQQAKIDKITLEIGELNKEVSTEALTEAFTTAGIKGFNEEMLKTSTGIKDLRDQLNELDQKRLTTLKETLSDIGLGADKAEEYVEQLRGTLGGIKEDADGIKKSASEMENLKNQVLQFFSLTNSIQLFKRAVTQALNTVKELDATMTEAAVVTEFDVGDMWDKLPQYAKHAQELGVSINGMYQATTLYYQQGLKTNEAMVLGIETMKMGKIASMDSTEATKAMTAALRGFNMELNETSAIRVNDVYSQLAAVTAADTNQIATAMEKTASIAASANMEFETTAALLAQIIETTQEAPETAGTAMKTIIARFSEVKSLRDQGLVSGKDAEGESIDVNKIQAALKTVGISMEGFFAGTEGLDSILLKLASKWKDLDFETQRYIATMAAGSRQQSRFIAMMSDYGRTMELVDEAQNSTGASQKQFEKTLDSMASKLQKLKNAWDQFLMGLSNNDILKDSIDLLTNLVTGINKLVDALSFGSGKIKSLVSLITVIGGLSVGKAALEGSLGWVGTQLGLQTQMQPTQEKWGKFKQIDSALANTERGGGRRIMAVGNAVFLQDGSENAKKVANAAANRASKKEMLKARTALDFKQALGNQKDTKAAKEAMVKYNEALKENVDSQDKLSLAAKAATEEFENQGGKMAVSIEESKKLKFATGALSVDFKALGGTVAGVGAALGGLSALLQAFGLDEQAEEVGKLSGIIMGVGVSISTLGPLFQKVGAEIAAAGYSAQTAWWPLLIIGAALAVIIIGIAHVAKNSETAEEKAASLEKTIDDLTNSAKQAEEALQSLADTQKELANLQSTMSGLVKGTDEWRKSLTESNNKVLELLNTYPQLSKWIRFNEDGLMSVDPQGYFEIAKQQTNAYIASNQAANALTIQKTNIEHDSVKEGNEVVKKARENALEQTGQIQLENYFNSLVQNNNTLSGSIESLAAASLLANQDISQFARDLEIFQEDVDIKEGQRAADDIKQEYAKIMSINLSEVQKQLDEGTLKWETVKNTVASDRQANVYTNRIQKLGRQIQKSENKELLTALLNNKGTGLTKAQLQEIKNSIGVSGAGAVLTEADLQATLGDIKLTDEEFQNLWENLKKVNETFINLEKTFEESGLSARAQQTLGTKTHGVAYGIALKAAGLESSKKEGFSKFFDDLLGKLPSQDQDKFLEQFAITNWKSIEDITSTFELWSGKVGWTPDEVELLAKEMAKLTNAVSDNTVEQNQQRGFASKELKDQILSGELTNVMNTEQKASLINTGGFSDSDFIQTGIDEFVYNGDLYSRVVNLYTDSIENGSGTVEGLQNEVEIGENLTKALDEKTGINLVLTPGEVTNFQQAQYFGASATGGKKKVMTWEEYVKDDSPFTVEELEQDPELLATYQEGYVQYIQGLGAGPTSKKNIPTATKALSITQSIELLKTGVEATDAEINSIMSAMAEVMNISVPNLEGFEEKRQWIIDNYDHYIIGLQDLQNQLYTSAMQQASGVAGYTGSTATYDYAGDALINEEDKKDYKENYEKGVDTRYTLYGAGAYQEDAENAVKNMTDLTEGTQEYDLLVKTLAGDIAALAKRARTAGKNMSGLKDVLSSNKRQTEEYHQALEKAYANIGSIFGQDADWAKNLQLEPETIEGLVAGDDQAFTKLKEKVAESVAAGWEQGQYDASSKYALLHDYTEENGKTIQQEIEILMGTDEQAAAEAQARVSAWFNSLGADANAAKQQFAWLAEINGATVSFTTKTDSEGNPLTTFAVENMDLSSFFKQGYSGGGGGGSKYENKYDKLHNTLEEINDLLRERERLERRYQKLLDRGTKSMADIQKARQEQVDNLQQEIVLQEKVIQGRVSQVEESLAKNSSLQKYIQVIELANGEKSIRIDWEAINRVRSSSTGENIDKFYDENKEWLESIYEAEQTIAEKADETYDLLSEGKDEYMDIENQVVEAIKKREQDEIDALTNINDSINETNSKLLESMQKQIDEYRQNRENQETEEEISDKQRRLAYLQQDTSGANAIEILQLQKEIEESQEDYTDALIDQKISELQDQNDFAAEQRQHQIDLLQSQLDHYIESGAVWEEVDRLLSSAFETDGSIKADSELLSLLKDANNYQGLSQVGRMDWLRGIETTLANGLAWKEGGGVLSTFWSGQDINFTTSDGKMVSGRVGDDGKVTDAQGNVYDQVVWQGGNSFNTKEAFKETPEIVEPDKEPWTENYPMPSSNTRDLSVGDSGEDVKGLQRALQILGFYGKSWSITGYFGNQTRGALIEFQKAAKQWYPEIGSADGKVGAKTRAAFGAHPTKQFKTGGLADFTGPAWLDGTKSKPEYVLNSDQTKAFFTLVDVLDSLQMKPEQTTQNNGDNTFDIDINVESIGNDYDVEQLAETVKRLINDDARYRNNNAINLMR